MESTTATNVESNTGGPRRLVDFCTRGVAFGVLSYLVGYCLVAALFEVGPANVDGHLETRLKWFGFVFYNAQFVPITMGEFSYNYLTEATNSAVPTVVYHAIPVVTIGATSVAFAVRNRIEGTVETIVYAGASVSVGYALMIIIGTFIFTVSFDGLTARPDLVKAAAFGAAYPVVLATIGALVVALYRHQA